VSDEIELLIDGDGLAVIGKKSVVERFVTERGLLSNSVNIGLHKLGDLAQTADARASGASEIAANSGRWLKVQYEIHADEDPRNQPRNGG
jgi:hypothetical protein